MSVHHGKGGKVKLTTNAIAEIRTFSYSESVSTADTTAMNDTAETHLVGPSAWNGKVDCWYDPADTNGQVALTIGASVDAVFYTDGDSSGKNTATGTATVETIDKNVDKGSTVEASFTLKGNGALVHGVVA